MGSNHQKDGSENIQMIIGKLLDKADVSIRPVISAFNYFRSRSNNLQRLNQPTLDVLEKCADFLGITLADKDGYKIFTKTSLATRIYLGLMALMPAKCGECSEEYVIEHDCPPFFQCFKCFKGSHHCDRNKVLHETLSAMNTPTGFVWLCNTCHESIDPIEPRKQRSRHTSATGNLSNAENHLSSGNMSDFTTSGLFSSTQFQLSQQQSNSTPPSDNAPHSSQTRENDCKNFLNWNCPHGISGKKKVNGKPCPHTHPRICYEYRVAGSTGKRGCKKGKNCPFFHPDICKTALEHGSCQKQDCSKFHPWSTRKKTKSRPKSATRDTNQQTRTKKQEKKATNANSSDFLELRDLVAGMATKLEALETKIDQGTPSPAYPSVRPPVGAHMMYQPPYAPYMMNHGAPRLPHHQIPHQAPYSHPSYY